MPIPEIRTALDIKDSGVQVFFAFLANLCDDLGLKPPGSIYYVNNGTRGRNGDQKIKKGRSKLFMV